MGLRDSVQLAALCPPRPQQDEPVGMTDKTGIAVNRDFYCESTGRVVFTLPLSFVRVRPPPSPPLYYTWDSLHIWARGFQSSLSSSDTASVNISPKGQSVVSPASLNQPVVGLRNRATNRP